MRRTGGLLAALAGALLACAPEAQDAEWRPAGDRRAELAIEMQLEPTEPVTADDRLRVVTFNVFFGDGVDELIELFSRAPLDRAEVFLLQEIEDRISEPGSRAAQIAEATGMAYVYLPSRQLGGGDGTHGMAILARRPMSEVRYMDLPFFGTSIRSDIRPALAVKIDGIDVVNIHLRLQLGIAERIIQLSPATRDLSTPSILGGDFNTNPYAWSDMIPILVDDPIVDLAVDEIVDDAMRDFGFDAATASSGATHDTPLSPLRLDSIYSRGLEIGESRVERSVDLSDHWPLWVDLAVPGSGAE